MKRSLAASILPLAAVLLAAAAGCYANRRTSVYETVFSSDMLNAEDAAMESAKIEQDNATKAERLKALLAEEDSVYRMSAGDQVEIRVYGHDDLSLVTRIGPDGTVGMLFLGEVVLGGCTIGEAVAKLEKGLAEYIKYPSVVIMVREIAGESVTIAGGCAKPGVYPISNTTRLTDIYAMAGGSGTRLFNGVDIDIADLSNSIVVRGDDIMPIDMEKGMKGDPLFNILMKKGDYVYIAQKLDSYVTICGDVRTPHKAYYESSMGLLEYLTAAGWMLETHWSHVIIIRDGLVNPRLFKIDIDAIVAGKAKNVRLMPNDIVYVPKDDLSEYNVFVRKLLPTAQLVNLLSSRVTAYTSN